MLFFFFYQKTAYDMRISDWSSDVCSSDLSPPGTFDVILSDAEYVQQLNAAGYIEKLDPADYPFDDFFPEFHNFPGHWKDNELYSVITRFGFLGVAHNTEAVTEKEARSYNRSEEKTSELQSLMRSSYAFLC